VSQAEAKVQAISVAELAALIIEAVSLEGVAANAIDPAAPLFGDGLGLDSLDMLEISLVIQQRYGIALKSDDPDNEAIFASLQSLAAHLSAAQGVRP
jgi:acyl carrier protein